MTFYSQISALALEYKLLSLTYEVRTQQPTRLPTQPDLCSVYM